MVAQPCRTDGSISPRLFSIIQKVERRERKQLANDEKDLFAEEFMQLAYEIKQKLHIYTEDEKKKMLRMLNETYNKLDKETNIRKRAEKEWRWLRIDLFKLNKRYNFRDCFKFCVNTKN